MLTSNQIIDIARLTEQTTFHQRDIARSVGTSHQSVGRAQKRLHKTGTSYSQLLEMEPDDIVLLRYPNLGKRNHGYAEPDWKQLLKETQVKGCTIRMKYLDYAAMHKEKAMAYSTLCRGLRKFKKNNRLSMKLTHRAGECLQVDFAGSTLKCPFAAKPVQFFGAVHPFSQRFFMLATLRQTTDDWIAGIQYTFESSGGTTEAVVPDNATAVVTKTGPTLVLNPKFKAFADHYGVEVLPARPRHPQDKALIEFYMRVFKESILPLLKQHVFSSLSELNSFLAQKVDEYNAQQFQNRSTSRQLLFDEFDKPMLTPLPSKPLNHIERIDNFVVRENYCFMVDEHTYSVPHSYRQKRVEVHVLAKVVQVWDGHKLVVEHVRSFEKGGETILDAHRHPDHLWFSDKPKEHYQEWANNRFSDDAVAIFIGNFFKSKHACSRIGNNRARKIQQFAEQYSADDFVAACRYALNTNQLRNIEMFEYILKSGVYKDEAVDMPEVVPGAHLLGGDYFAQKGVQL
jgi:transposase